MTSVLAVNQVYVPSTAVIAKVAEVLETSPKENLALGLLAEYLHDELLAAAGVSLTKPQLTDPYDRVVDGVLQDDKLATFSNGVLSPSHSISRDELLCWQRYPDVQLISWEMVSPNFEDGFRFRGVLSFQLLLQHDLIIASNYKPGQHYFFRKDAFQQALTQVQ